MARRVFQEPELRIVLEAFTGVSPGKYVAVLATDHSCLTFALGSHMHESFRVQVIVWLDYTKDWRLSRVLDDAPDG